MINHIFSRQNLAASSLIFVALIFMGAANYGKVRSQTDHNAKTEFPETGLNQPKDSLANSVFSSSGTPIKLFKSVIVDNDNTKWFLTEQGIISFNGEKWTLHDKNKKVPTQDLKSFALEVNTYGQDLWIASPKGATVATIPVDGRTGATTYHTENTPILTNNVLQVAIGKSPMRWFGTTKGISAFSQDKWLKGDYEELYPEGLFEDYPITAMAASLGGDSLYIATDGAGVARVRRNDVDGITGASVYAQWGPILLPSDKVYSVLITTNNTQWFGTEKGLARHIGGNTLANWTVFSTKDGLPDNFVQAIAAGSNSQIWIGTKGGASLYDGAKWTAFTKVDGLNSNNIRCITVDKSGVVWFGTDDGVTSYKDQKFTNYR